MAVHERFSSSVSSAMTSASRSSRRFHVRSNALTQSWTVFNAAPFTR